MAVLLVFSKVSLAVFCQSKPLTRFARSLIQGSRPPTATFEHFTGEGKGHGRACQRYDIPRYMFYICPGVKVLTAMIKLLHFLEADFRRQKSRYLIIMCILHSSFFLFLGQLSKTFRYIKYEI